MVNPWNALAVQNRKSDLWLRKCIFVLLFPGPLLNNKKFRGCWLLVVAYSFTDARANISGILLGLSLMPFALCM